MISLRLQLGALLFLFLACSPSDEEAMVESAGSSPKLSDWSELAEAPAEEQLRCARRTTELWSVVGSGEELRVVSREGGLVKEPLPFDPAPGLGERHQAGHRHVLEIDDGWLVGFDAGEYGGGLWWFGADGRKSENLVPAKGAEVRVGDPFRAENVQGFTIFDGAILVFMGLDHLTGRSGRVFRLTGSAEDWELEPVAVLDASPAAWIVDKGHLLVLTESGLWTLERDWKLERAHPVNLSGLAPASMARGPDGALSIGLRHYLLKLQPHHERSGTWSETWFAPRDCVQFRVDRRCECVTANPGV